MVATPYSTRSRQPASLSARGAGAHDGREACLGAVRRGMAAQITDVDAAVPGQGPLGVPCLCGDERCFAAAQRRRRRALDEHVHEVARRARPVKFTVVLRRVRPRRSVGSVRLGPSTRTLLDPAHALGVALCGHALDNPHETLDRSRLTSSGTLIRHRRRLRSARGEYTNVNALSYRTSSTTARVAWKSSSVSRESRR